MSENQLMAMSEKDMSKSTTAKLKKALSAGLSISAKQLGYLALIWKELENRGEDLSALKSGLAIYLPLIADDRLDPEVIVRFAGQKTLLAKAMGLSLLEQRKLLKRKTVELVSLDEQGDRVIDRRPLTQLSGAEVRQVLSESGIRNSDKQFELLITKPSGKKTKKGRARVSRKVTFDQVNNEELISISGKRIKPQVLFEAIEGHYGIKKGTFEKLISPQ